MAYRFSVADMVKTRDRFTTRYRALDCKFCLITRDGRGPILIGVC